MAALRAEIPDTTVFIHLTRAGADLESLRQRLARGNVWLSSVVVVEWLAGLRSAEEARLTERFAALLAGAGRLVVPSVEDWMLAARLMSRRVRLHGSLRPRDHLNDVLILVAAARLNGTVTTANVRHFEAWAVLARRAGMDVRVNSVD